MITTSTITCPHCGHQSTETMPEDACVHFYDCKNCGAQSKPLQGDCCVFCSYGDVPCPPKQEEKRAERPQRRKHPADVIGNAIKVARTLRPIREMRL